MMVCQRTNICILLKNITGVANTLYKKAEPNICHNFTKCAKKAYIMLWSYQHVISGSQMSNNFLTIPLNMHFIKPYDTEVSINLLTQYLHNKRIQSSFIHFIVRLCKKNDYAYLSVTLYFFSTFYH